MLLLTSNFPRWPGDSTTPFVLSLAEDLVKLDWQVEVLAPHTASAARRERMGDVNVRRFRYLVPETAQTVCYGGGALINLRNNPTDKAKLPLLVAAELASALVRVAAWRPAVVHAHWLLPQGFVGALVRRFTGVPVVTTIHGGDVFGLRGRALAGFKRFSLRGASVVTANSSATAAMVRELLPSLPVERISMGIDPSPPDPALAAAVRARHRAGDGPLILFLGRLVEEKGVFDLIDALPSIAAVLPDARLLVVGDGQDADRARARAAAGPCAERIDFTGWVAREQVPAYFAAADVFAGPSKRSPDGWVEAQGLTFAEALSAGTPVVATASGGIGDLIENERTGLLVPEGDVAALAAAIVRVIRTPTLAAGMTERGRALVASAYSRQSAARRFSNLFEAVGDRRRRASAA